MKCARCGTRIEEGAINVNVIDELHMTLCFSCAADLAEQLLSALICVYEREASQQVM